MIQQALVAEDALPWHTFRVRRRNEKKKGEEEGCRARKETYLKSGLQAHPSPGGHQM
jgi:hypothetical protein